MNEGIGTDNTRHYFGTDSYMSMIGSSIYFNYDTYLNTNTYLPTYITHNGDTNTSFGFPSADNFKVTAGGNDNFAVNASTVFLKHTGDTKLITTNTGVVVTGEIQLNDANTKLLEGSGNSLRIQTNSGYVDIGPNNTSWCHISTDRANFYFAQGSSWNGHVQPYNNLVSNLGGTANLWNVTYSRYFESNSTQSRTKIRVWSGTTYGLGMQSGYTFGGLDNEYAMTFQMSDSATRGFWWGDTGHTNARGAMALTTAGKLTVAHSLRLGYGESDTTVPGATYALDVSGKIRATDDIIAYSDARVKDNVKTIENALEKVTKLRGVSYNRNDIKDKSNKIGVIAQEVKEVLPEIVSEDGLGMNSVAYGNMAGVFIEAIKELENRIKELENKPCNCNCK